MIEDKTLFLNYINSVFNYIDKNQSLYRQNLQIDEELMHNIEKYMQDFINSFLSLDQFRHYIGLLNTNLMNAGQPAFDLNTIPELNYAIKQFKNELELDNKKRMVEL